MDLFFIWSIKIIIIIVKNRLVIFEFQLVFRLLSFIKNIFFFLNFLLIIQRTVKIY